ncbi:MAG: hypothetical protein K2M31_06125 [Muribaculaceae bacterium]|nr:hypothetical protein [Muribaculaceae bacterium]
MKATSYSILGLGLIVAGLLTSCQDHYDEPALDVPQATLVPNTTIAEMKASFGDELAVKLPYKDPDAKVPYIIHGRVISSDASGNIYKSLVIQDETSAIAMSINQSSMYIDYRLGQEVVLNATEMWMGMYNNYIQFGMLGEYNGMPQITFMAYDTFKAHAQLNGLPNQNFKYVNYGKPQPADDPYCLIFRSFSEIPAAGEEYVNVMSQLVEFPNVSFVDADGETTFAPYQDNADRYIKDANGATLNVRCSGYSSFYNDLLPQGTGTVRGILSRYGDSWQLLLRGKEDLIFDDAGTREHPYPVEKALEMNDNGRNGWVEGVIIGSVKAGVGTVTDLDQISFTASEAEYDNNVVIAAEASCRDLEKMMIVELPAGSRIREWVNLLDNPDVLGKKLVVKGSMNEWLGMHGITEVGDAFSDFEVAGQVIPGVTGQGNGTKDSPFTVAYLKAVDDVDLTNVYVEGYVVGWISGRDFEKGAHFSGYDRGDYNGNNIILGQSASLIGIENVGEGIAQSVPVSLSDLALRDAYGLVKNPGMLGRKVRIRGNVAKTNFGVRGVSLINEIEVIE